MSSQSSLPFLVSHRPLAPFSTIGLGGPARYFCQAESPEQAAAALAWAEARGLPVFILGGGSNVLIGDQGYDGLVIRIGMRGRQASLDKGYLRVRVAAGEVWDDFVAWSIFQGASGIECLSGIPGQVGATPIQNVGAYGQEVAESIVAVEGMDRATRQAVRFTGAECHFAYRHSRFKAGDRDAFLLTAVTFKLPMQRKPRVTYGDLQQELQQSGRVMELTAGRAYGEALRAAVLRVRRRKSMVVDGTDPDSRSLGSFFLNPMLTRDDYELFLGKAKGLGLTPPSAFEQSGRVKVPAAWLIEKAGIRRGMNLAGAAVSQAHALALVNRGGSAEDVKALARHIQQQVRSVFGIGLELEPLFL